MSNRIANIWRTRTPFVQGEAWPIRVDSHVEPGIDEAAVTWVESACILGSKQARAHADGEEVAFAAIGVGQPREYRAVSPIRPG